MKTLHLGMIISIGIAVITSGIFLINYGSHTPTCIEGRLPNGTCAGPIAIELGTSEKFVRMECDTPYVPPAIQTITLPNGTVRTINKIPVFLMQPNSTGKVCTKNWSYYDSTNYSGKVLAGIGKGSSEFSNVTISPFPNNIDVNHSMNKTIAYTITTSKNAGFYRINPMFSNCGGFPLAVGYDKSHLFDNDFPWLWDTLPCPFIGIGVQVTGVSGIDVAYITKVY
jgi:hypothetical protein